MDEITLKKENLGHFHTKHNFLFILDLEKRISTKFAFLTTLNTGIHIINLYYIISFCISLYFKHSNIFMNYSIKLNYFWLTIKIFSYMVAYCLLYISISKNKSYKDYAYISYLLYLCLFIVNLLSIIYNSIKHQKFDSICLIFLLIDLYFLWIIYSCMHLVSKEMKYVIKGKERKPTFLKDEYKDILSEADYNLIN